MSFLFLCIACVCIFATDENSNGPGFYVPASLAGVFFLLSIVFSLPGLEP
jgi:hypothetical protein